MAKFIEQSKEELLENLSIIDKRIVSNKEVLEPYLGKEMEPDMESRIQTLLALTKDLLAIHYKIKDILLTKYGVFVMDDIEDFWSKAQA